MSLAAVPAQASLQAMRFPAAPVVMQPLVRAPARFLWKVPGSKSMTNRALLLAALAEGDSEVVGALDSDDTCHMRNCLTGLGLEVGRPAPDRFVVQGGVRRLRPPAGPLFVGNSGTTVRFVTPLAALVGAPVTLVGDAAMGRRPIDDLVAALRDLGVQVDCPTGCPPLTVHGQRLRGGRVAVAGNRSSQFLSGLLMAAPLAAGPLTIVVKGALVSEPYVAMTVAMVVARGGRVQRSEAGYQVEPSVYRSGRIEVEPDASAASYAWAAAVVLGITVSVPGLGGASLQGDTGFTQVLARMGATVQRDGHGLSVVGGPGLRGVDVDLRDISDTTMTLAALAPLADGPTTIRGIGFIRRKETDRVAATATELRRLGQEVEEGEDHLVIHPRPLRPATVECYGDHRMAMAFAILGLARPGVGIADPACVAKTYPGFWNDLAGLYQAAGQPVPWSA